jgi:hypothetical protein
MFGWSGLGNVVTIVERERLLDMINSKYKELSLSIRLVVHTYSHVHIHNHPDKHNNDPVYVRAFQFLLEAKDMLVAAIRRHDLRPIRMLFYYLSWFDHHPVPFITADAKEVTAHFFSVIHH